MTRATFYNHYSSPLELLIQVLLTDLGRAHLLEEERRAEGRLSAAEMLRLSIVDVADHIERFEAVYRQAVHDPADGAVYEALVLHFTDYAVAYIAQCTHPDLPDTNHQVIAHFVARWICRGHQGMARRQLCHQGGPGRRRRCLCAGLVDLNGNCAFPYFAGWRTAWVKDRRIPISADGDYQSPLRPTSTASPTGTAATGMG